MPSYTVTRSSWFSCKQELRENNRFIGELTMLRKLSCALAEARMPDRTAVFGYKGWTAQALFIRDSSGKDIATVKSLSWWKREVAVTIDGANYAWKQKTWWGMRSGWFAPDGREIMEFRWRWWGRLDIDSPTVLDKKETLLLFFGMYLMGLQERTAVLASV